jgi:CBS domain-containing protein
VQNMLLVTSRGRIPAALPRRAHAADTELAPGDAALRALTDFCDDWPITADVDRSIDDALADMIRFGVRALLVTRSCYESRMPEIAGLITSYDIQGERPIQFLQASNQRRHSEICVGHVMTPWDELPLLDYESLRSLSVAGVHELLLSAGLTHLLVVELNGNEPALVRGLLSRSELERRLRSAGTPGGV